MRPLATACCARHRPVQAAMHKAEERGGHPRIQQEAADYMRQNGLVEPVTGRHVVDENLLRRAAAAYEALPHMPGDPQVAAAYAALKRETLAQYNHLQRLGYKFEPHPQAALTPESFADGPQGADVKFTPIEGAPYQNENDIIRDLVQNKHLHVFNGGEIAPDHPLAETIPGHALGNYNTVFRAVHDVFGHGKTGADFGHHGEDRAWRSHAAMYSPLARRALATETRGQNSAFHFGTHGEHNRSNPAQAVYPDQKAALMPEEFAHPRANLPAVAEPVKKAEGAPVSQDPKRAVHQALYDLYQGVLKPLAKKWEEQVTTLAKTEAGEAVDMAKVAPPEFDEKAMHKLKAKYGKESAFKIAWAAHNKHKGDVKKAILDFAKGELDKAEDKKCPKCGADHGGADHATATLFGDEPKPLHPRDKKMKKAAVTDGGMGDMAAPPAPNLGEDMALSEHDGDDPMCKCEGCGRIDAYAKAEAPMAKASNPIVAARMAANKAKAKAAAAQAPAPQPQPAAKAEHTESPMCKCSDCDDMDRYAKGETPMAKEHLGFNKLKNKLAHKPGIDNPAAVAAKIGRDKYGAKGMAAKAHHAKAEMPAGSSPTSPDMPVDGKPIPKAKVAAPKTQEGGNGSKPEALGKVSNPIVAARLAANKAKAKAAAPKPEEPKAEPVAKASNPIVAARMAANKAKAKAAQAAPKPEEKPAEVAKAALNTSAPAPAGAAAASPGAPPKPKNPIASMKTAVAGMKQAVAKLPGTTAAAKPPKPPAMGAGTPTAKAELGKTAISPRDIHAQAAKRAAAAASAGNLMDTMLATHPAGAQGATITGVMPGPAAAHKITLPGAHLFGKK